MSCLDVMYHQGYGAHLYWPAPSSSPASSSSPAACSQPAQQQQKRFGMCSRMDDFIPQSSGKKGQSEAEEEEQQCKDAQPAEAEYLSSRCVLFTYFRGEIGDVVDEHFSRALSQPSTFSNKMGKVFSAAPYKGNSQSETQSPSLPLSLCGSSYPSLSSPCLAPTPPDFPPGTSFHVSDPGLWSSPGLVPPHSDSWHYNLGAQGGPGYPHIHPRHPHHMLHHTHSPALNPRFSPLLLSCATPSCRDAVKPEPEPSCTPALSWHTAFQGTVDIYETALQQDKSKASVWF